MPFFNTYDFNAERFITVALLLLFVYLLLNVMDSLLENRNFLGRWHKRVSNWVHDLYIIYEPFALVIITVSLVLINPQFIGLVVGICILTGIGHLRNYFSGRLVQLDKGIEIGKQIKTGEYQGIISQIGRFGIRVKTAKGLQYLSYPQLINPGYTLSAGEDTGGFYRLTLRKADNDDPLEPTTIIKLKDLFTKVPYLDWNHDSELAVSYDHPNLINTKVLVREDHHLQDLIGLIQEWGYACKVSKK